MSEPKAVTIYTRGIATPGGGAYKDFSSAMGGARNCRPGRQASATTEWICSRPSIR